MATKPAAQPLRTSPVSDKVTFDVRHAHLLKGKTLMPLSIEQLDDKLPSERKFRSVKEIEELLLQFSKILFGQHSFVVLLTKASVKLFGTDEPSFFLLDLNGDVAKPRFYLVTVALSRNTDTGHLLLRLGKYLMGLRSANAVTELIDVLTANKPVRTELLLKMKADDIPHYLKVALTHSSVLVVLDGQVADLPEVIGTLSGTSWQSTKTVVFKKYALGKDTVLSMSPAFGELHLNGKERRKNAPVTEEYHLMDVDDPVRAMYQTIKIELLKANPALIFNVQKYYISIKNHRNVAIVQFSKRKLSIVVMIDEKATRKKIKHHEIRSLKDTVQKFWSGPCCTVVIENNKHLSEVTSLLKDLVKP